MRQVELQEGREKKIGKIEGKRRKEKKSGIITLHWGPGSVVSGPLEVLSRSVFGLLDFLIREIPQDGQIREVTK